MLSILSIIAIFSIVQIARSQIFIPISSHVTVDLRDPQTGHITVEESIENKDIADYVRKLAEEAIKNATKEAGISPEEQQKALKNTLTQWLDDAEFENVKYQIFGLKDYGKPLRWKTEADFRLTYNPQTDHNYTFRNDLFVGETYIGATYRLVLPKGFEIVHVSTEPEGSYSISEQDGRKVVLWNIIRPRTIMKVVYAEKVAHPEKIAHPKGGGIFWSAFIGIAITIVAVIALVAFWRKRLYKGISKT